MYGKKTDVDNDDYDGGDEMIMVPPNAPVLFTLYSSVYLSFHLPFHASNRTLALATYVIFFLYSSNFYTAPMVEVLLAS